MDRRVAWRQFLTELKRRRVYHVATIYAGSMFVLLQAADLILPALGLRGRAFTMLVVLAIFGFPVALVLSWVFELGPEGVRRTTDVPTADPQSSSSSASPFQVSFAAMVVLLSLGGAWGSWQLWLSPRTIDGNPNKAPPTTFDSKRLAVLYFDDHSPGDSLQYLANGITEGLIHELSQVEPLDVVSRNGVKPFRAGDISLDSVVSTLEVGTLIEGSVQQSGDSVRLTAQLIDAASLSHLESLTVDRASGELLSLQDELVRRVSEALLRRLGEELRLATEKRSANSQEAWKLVQKAKTWQNRADDLVEAGQQDAGLEALDRADSLLARAKSLDEQWTNIPTSQGWIDYKRSRWFLGDSAAVDGWTRQGLEHANRALALDSLDSSALELRGTLQYWRSLTIAEDDSERQETWMSQAAEDLLRAVEANPSQASAWASLSHYYLRTGQRQKAMMAASTAYDEDAYLDNVETVLHRLHSSAFDLKDGEGARRWCGELARRFPEHPRSAECRLILQMLPDAKTNPDSAWRLAYEYVERSAPGRADYTTRVTEAMVAVVLARHGLTDSARHVAERAVARARELGPSAEHETSFVAAYAMMLAGNFERAHDLLGRPAPNQLHYWWWEDLRAHLTSETESGITSEETIH